MRRAHDRKYAFGIAYAEAPVAASIPACTWPPPVAPYHTNTGPPLVAAAAPLSFIVT